MVIPRFALEKDEIITDIVIEILWCSLCIIRYLSPGTPDNLESTSITFVLGPGEFEIEPVRFTIELIIRTDNIITPRATPLLASTLLNPTTTHHV